VIKFVVVVYRRPDWTATAFRRYFETTHGPLARKLPGLSTYIQNFPAADDTRHPTWDAVVEFYFASREAMEAAWASDAGQKATADLQVFADLTRSSWGVVDAVNGLR
jgi:uncharacterized protein (TIGR02118 family)